jgi:hypothetical protein
MTDPDVDVTGLAPSSPRQKLAIGNSAGQSDRHPLESIEPWETKALRATDPDMDAMDRIPSDRLQQRLQKHVAFDKNIGEMNGLISNVSLHVSPDSHPAASDGIFCLFSRSSKTVETFPKKLDIAWESGNQTQQAINQSNCSGIAWLSQSRCHVAAPWRFACSAPHIRPTACALNPRARHRKVCDGRGAALAKARVRSRSAHGLLPPCAHNARTAHSTDTAP